MFCTYYIPIPLELLSNFSLFCNKSISHKKKEKRETRDGWQNIFHYIYEDEILCFFATPFYQNKMKKKKLIREIALLKGQTDIDGNLLHI